MTRNRLLSLLLAGALAVSAVPGCGVPGIPSSFIAAVRIAAVALPAFDIPESQLEAHPGAIPFNIYLFVEPLTPEEGLSIDLDALTEEEPGYGVRGEELEVTIQGKNLTYTPEAACVNFAFQSDGVGYPASAVESMGGFVREDEGEGATMAEPGEGGQLPVVVTQSLSGSGGDVMSAYQSWVGVLGEGGDRCYYRNEPLDSARGGDIRLQLEGGNLDFLEDIEDVQIRDELLVWEIDPDDRPLFLSVPVAPLVTISPVEFPDTSDLWGAAGPPESYWTFYAESGYDTGTNVSQEEDLIAATLDFDGTGEEAAEIDAFRLNRAIEFEDMLPHGDYLAASPMVPGLVEAVDVGEDMQAYLPYHLPASWVDFVDDEPEGGDDPGAEAEPGTFGWVSDGVCFGEYCDFTTVLSVPVDYDSLFNPEEPHEIQLPWTFWLSLLPGPATQLDGLPGQTPLDGSGESAPPQEDESAPESFLAASIEPVSETIEDESGCRSILTIGYGAVDLTGGSRLVSDVSLRVDGEELYPWSGTPTDHYQDSALLESGCSEVHLVQVAATNAEGQTVAATREVPVPPLSTHFGYGILDVPGEGECRMQLFIEYEAVDLTTPDSPLASVVVKANGSVWRDSGAISTDRYADSFSREVGCGHVYLIEVKGTDADGSIYTYRETVNIPVSTPPEPPEPPAPPPPQTTLYAASAASAQCTASGAECSCSLSISFDGKDLTGGDYPVTSVVLRVNGQVWHDSGSVSTTQYHQTVQRTVGCGQTFNIALTVNNSIGQTATSTGSLTTPVPQ